MKPSFKVALVAAFLTLPACAVTMPTSNSDVNKSGYTLVTGELITQQEADLFDEAKEVASAMPTLEDPFSYDLKEPHELESVSTSGGSFTFRILGQDSTVIDYNSEEDKYRLSREMDSSRVEPAIEEYVTSIGDEMNKIADENPNETFLLEDGQDSLEASNTDGSVTIPLSVTRDDSFTLESSSVSGSTIRFALSKNSYDGPLVARWNSDEGVTYSVFVEIDQPKE